ncbi:Dyp-type peroxidase [Conexibacter stalactiti]|uniref:Dyp-type peroxidase n=1 Tax=Conexibacter stalactiti TaxID=1940611 RepID=A0ABU4HKJ6_9ACTN|nr:Dyp-type peroxidase [Conexibacter stalactiti]MDW5593830.1 Dyp-type peroxidase [Conexibacter stalactiti]MEC5034472.1 Dyp-type peroxidase [Conexibacter stalactiti]
MRAPRLSRREALAGVAIGAVAGGAAMRLADAAESAAPQAVRPFDGPRQAGIVPPPQDHLTLAAFDLHTPDRADLPRLLRSWTELVVALCGADPVAHDTGERTGLALGRLTVTVGFGTSLFDGRYGLGARRPAGLAPDALPGDDRLDPRRSGGDLLVQVRGDDRQVVFHAVHQLTNAALGIARRRWTQHGFLSRAGSGETPRNLFGFKDGTVNPGADDDAALARHVWVASGPLTGGTYLVYRRIRMRMQAWDRSSLDVQEHAVGRRKAGGGALDGGDERAPLALRSAPPRSHVRLAHPDANDGVRMLRRAYNYDDGATADGEPDAGMAFLCFVADPARQVGSMLTRMERHDELHRYLVHTGGGVYAVPLAPAPGEHLGEELFR